jgi:hypothetical protein
MIRASLTAAPPVKPKVAQRTNQRPRNYWTIHSHPNDAFTLKINDTVRTSVVGFQEIDDAIFIGKMLETYFMSHKEWPDTKQVGALILPTARTGDVLNHIYIQKWDFDDLKVTCTKNFLDMVSVDSIVKSKNGYSFSGKLFKFEAEPDFYRFRIGELYTL